jgi:hypothetical protein
MLSIEIATKDKVNVVMQVRTYAGKLRREPVLVMTNGDDQWNDK